MNEAIENKISLNPILNAFQDTVHKYEIPSHLYNAFMESMEKDLYQSNYLSKTEYDRYIYGSADVVGLMCLKVFVKGDEHKYDQLKDNAMRLGSAFQKINFLRDLKADMEGLERSYFPHINFNTFDEANKNIIIAEIEEDFKAGLNGIIHLPIEAKLEFIPLIFITPNYCTKSRKHLQQKFKNAEFGSLIIKRQVCLQNLMCSLD